VVRAIVIIHETINYFHDDIYMVIKLS